VSRKVIIAISSMIALVGVGCSLDLSGDEGGRRTADGGADGGVGGDSGSADTASPPPMSTGPTTSGPFPASGDSAYASEDAAGEPGLLGSASCFDGVDNDDAADGFDCADPDCAGIASCRVGNGNLCTVVGASALPIDGCAEMPATATCLSGIADAFGSPGPWVASGALHPGGNTADSGLVYAATVPLRSHRLALKATFQEPTCGAGDPCRDTIALGVTTQTKPELDMGARVRAEVALAYSASREEISLLISGTVASSWPFDSASPSWTLVLRPDGLIDVKNEMTSVFTSELMPYAPIDDARVIIFGRSPNRAYPSPDGAAITSLEVESAVCDIPSAWEERGALSITLSGGAGFPIVGPAQVTTEIGGAMDPRRYLVYRDAGEERQGRFMAAFESTIGPRSYVLAHTLEAPILVPESSYESGGIADPDLSWDEETGVWHLYYTATDDGGVRGIAHASGETFDTLTRDGTLAVDPALYEDIRHVEMPSYVRTESGVGVLILRAVGLNGGHQLVAFIDDGSGWARLTSSPLDELTERGIDPVGARFDADEIAHPAVVRVGGSYHIYYAGRRGTRWGIGLLATDELEYVRDVTGEQGALLAGSGEDFDSLGVTEPDVVIADGEVALMYIGTDGAERAIGRAARRVGDGS
jgi:hypothetical protein